MSLMDEIGAKVGSELKVLTTEVDNKVDNNRVLTNVPENVIFNNLKNFPVDADWDTLNEAGTFRGNAGTHTNTPEAGAWNWILEITVPSTGNCVYQEAYKHENDTTKKFIRSWDATYGWQPWGQILTTNSDIEVGEFTTALLNMTQNGVINFDTGEGSVSKITGRSGGLDIHSDSTIVFKESDLDVAAVTISTNNKTVTAGKFISNIVTGTSPLTISSTTKVTNLNADQLDGFTSGDFAKVADAGSRYYLDNELDSYITAENIFGDTAVAVDNLHLACHRTGNMATVCGRLRVFNFSQAYPTDDTFVFTYDLESRASAIGWFDNIVSTSFGVAVVNFTGTSGQDTAFNACRAYATTSGLQFWMGESERGGTAITVDECWIHFTITMEVS